MPLVPQYTNPYNAVVLSEHDFLEVFLLFILLYQRLYCSVVLSDSVMVNLCNQPNVLVQISDIL